MEKRFFRSDGTEFWTHLTVSLVRDEAGAPAYHVTLLEEVSEWPGRGGSSPHPSHLGRSTSLLHTTTPLGNLG